jgi:hypothetical protein
MQVHFCSIYENISRVSLEYFIGYSQQIDSSRNSILLFTITHKYLNKLCVFYQVILNTVLRNPFTTVANAATAFTRSCGPPCAYRSWSDHSHTRINLNYAKRCSPYRELNTQCCSSRQPLRGTFVCSLRLSRGALVATTGHDIHSNDS